MTLDEKKAEALEWLQKAFELEWSTIPPYMMALLSIQHPKNRVAADLIRSVMLEEMLHMALVGNLIASLSGKVVVGSGNVPGYPLKLNFRGEAFRDRLFDVDLAPFSPETLETFLNIELPENWEPEKFKVQSELDIPALTIGEFYRMILQKLRAMCDDHGEATVFSQTAPQVRKGYYWSSGGNLTEVRGIDQAALAIDEIVAQGEGARIPEDGLTPIGTDPAHFFRFREIKFAQFYRPEDDIRAQPSGDKFEVDYSAVYPILKNPKSSDYAAGTKLAELNDSFNRAYTLMLIEIAGAFNGAPRTLYSAIMNGMHTLTSTAQQMIQLPVRGTEAETNAAPSFEWMAP